MKTEKKYDIVIVGGGISGLSLGYLLAQMDREVLILEKSNRVGGAIEGLSYDDYYIDLGSHTGYNSYVSLLELAEDTNAQLKLQGREKKKYFFATHEGFQKLTRPLHFASLFWNLRKLFCVGKEGKSVKEYYAHILGKKNYEDFAQHFFKAVLCQRADDYPAAFFLKRRSTKNKSFPKSFTFTNGMQTFSEALQSHPKVTILKNVEILNISKEKEEYKIETSKGNWTIPDLAFAAYAEEVAKLIENIAPKVARQLTTIPYQVISSFGIIVQKEFVGVGEFAGLLTDTSEFTSIVSRDIASHQKYRGFTIHAQGEISQEVLEERICRVLQISPDKILKKQYKNSYLPKLQKEHQNFIEEIKEAIEEVSNLYIVGNYFQGLSLEDCLLRSKAEALRYISNV